jgi:MutS domain V
MLRAGPSDCAFSAAGLYDLCLSLAVTGPVVGNDVGADGKPLVVITAANQGGKSAFLRSVGLAQLMMQAGMFAATTSLRASVCHGLFTHYKGEEDASMTSGKLDEERASRPGPVPAGRAATRWPADVPARRGDSLPTSHGKDVYESVFGDSSHRAVRSQPQP